jgi:transposase
LNRQKFADSQTVENLRISGHKIVWLESVMAAPYSQDLRVRVVAAVTSGISASAAARQFGIGISTAIRWSQRWRAEGHANPRAMGGDRRSRLKDHRITLLTLVAEQPDMTIAEVRTALAAKAGIQVGVGTICRFFALHKMTLKKRACMPRSKRVQT